MSEIDRIRHTAARALTLLVVLQVAVTLPLGLVSGNDAFLPFLMGLPLAGAAALTYLRGRGDLTNRLTLAIVQMLLVGNILVLFKGHTWQVDWHMYFFAMLALVASLCDWRAILLATGVVAVHHLSLNFVLPSAVFPGGTDLGRVILHTLILVLEAAVLTWFVLRFTRALSTAQENADAAEAAREDAERLALEKREMDEAQMVQLHRKVEELAQQVEEKAAETLRSTNSAGQEMASATDRMSQSAQRVLTTANDMSASARQTMTNLESVTEAAGRLSSTVNRIEDQVRESREAVTEAVTAEGRAQETIRSLSDAATTIGEVANLISDIASQTNLLALNATIEAARAGEAGRGFAVVASEVKGLAIETARSTEEIGNQIANIQATTTRAVKAVYDMGQHLGAVRKVGDAVAGVVEEQIDATRSIQASIEGSREATETTVAFADLVASEARDSGAVSDELQAAVYDVTSGVEELGTTIVRAVRTAIPDVDRREAPRLHVSQRAEISCGDGSSAPGKTVDISESGVQVALEQATVTFAGPLTVSIADGPQGLPIVIRSHKERIVNLSFDDLSHDQKSALSAYLKSQGGS